MSPRKAEPPTIEYVLLGLIHLHPSHGYDLLQTLKEGTGIGMIWHIKPGRLYALLDKLEQMGWLESEVKPGEAFMPRKEYRTSKAGEKALHEWMHTPVGAAHRMRQEFLARLFFAIQDSPKTAKQIIDTQTQTCSEWLENLKAEEQHHDTGAPFEQMVIRFRIGQIQSMIDWLKYCRAQYT